MVSIGGGSDVCTVFSADPSSGSSSSDWLSESSRAVRNEESERNDELERMVGGLSVFRLPKCRASRQYRLMTDFELD